LLKIQREIAEHPLELGARRRSPMKIDLHIDALSAPGFNPKGAGVSG
jgi:hypothetical protein